MFPLWDSVARVAADYVASAPKQTAAATFDHCALHHYGVSSRAELIAKVMRDRKPTAKGPYGDLTPAQRRVVDLLAEGLTRPQIARRLRLSPYTVHNHVKGARETYRVKTQTQLLSKVFGSYRRAH